MSASLAPEDVAQLREALHWIPADVPRPVWYRIAMAIQHAMGDAGRAVFMDWSESAKDVFEVRAAINTWNSCKSYGNSRGKVTEGTLFKMARDCGWQGEINPEAKKRWEAAAAARALRADGEQRRLAERYERMAEEAKRIVENCTRAAGHPYMMRKGLPRVMTLQDDAGNLVVPMYAADINHGRYLQAIQRIPRAADGAKLMMAGARASCSVLKLGPSDRDARAFVFTESFANGWSIRNALDTVYLRDVAVWVGFACNYIQHLLKWIPQGKPAVWVADNDRADKHGYRGGARYANRSGLAWWEPPRPADWPAHIKSFDANDHHKVYGLGSLGDNVEALLHRSDTPGPGDVEVVPFEPAEPSPLLRIF